MTQTHTHTRTHARTRARTQTHTHKHTQTPTLTHTHPHSHTHARTHAPTHTHKHTHEKSNCCLTPISLFTFGIQVNSQFCSEIVQIVSACSIFCGFTETCHMPNICTCEVVVYLQLFDRETLLDSRLIHVRTCLPPSVHVSAINPTG